MAIPAHAMSDLAVTYRPTASLKPSPNNPRTHSRKQVRKLVASLREFGWVNPCLIDAEGNVVCGHGRLLAAKELGFETVPTITLAHLTPAQLRAYVIADNALAEKAGWSRGLLRTELQGLIEIGYNVELTGFDTIEIDTLLTIGGDDAQQQEEAEEVEPRPGAVITRLNDHWTIGRHHLVCGDARDTASYEALLADERAQLVFTDPPYNCRIAGNVSGLGRVKHGEFVMGSGELSDADFSMQLLRPAFRNVAKFSAPGAIAFACMDWRGGRHLLDAADGVFAELKNLIVWVKTNAGMGSFYRSQHEFIFSFKISKGTVINNFQLGQGGRHRSNVWTYEGANTFRKGRIADLAAHSTVKPRKLVADAILDCSRPDGIVLDPFLGSGTTLAAAEVTNRRGYGLELDPKYCDVILRRLHALTGEVPRLIGGGSFDEVAADRSAAEGL